MADKYFVLTFLFIASFLMNACDLKEVSVPKATPINTISKEQKTKDSINIIASIAHAEGYKLGKEEVLDLYIAKSSESLKYLQMFLSDNEAERTQFVRHILYNPKFDYESTENELQKQRYGLNIRTSDNPKNTLPTRFQYFEKEYFHMSTGGYTPIVGWYYRLKLVSKYVEGNILGYLVRSINRNEETIAKLYESYKDIILKELKPQVYQRMAKGIVKKLIEHYEYWQKNDYKSAFEKYKKLEKNNIAQYSFRDGKFVNQIDTDKKKKTYLNCRYVGACTWIDNFWYRRYTEKNMEIVYKILKEVDTYYAKFPPLKNF